MAGCRCLPCRAANSTYGCSRYHARKSGDFRETVTAKSALAHIRYLSRNGIGRVAISEAAKVSAATIHDLLSGRAKRIRRSTERAILSVGMNARAAGALISACKTWHLIDELTAEGYTKTQLSMWLGYKRPHLGTRRQRITLHRANTIHTLYLGIKAGRFQR
jgi:hypothetical protein